MTTPKKGIGKRKPVLFDCVVRCVQHTGLNEYADANSIVILYPQATTTVLNPKGCWDWWGYAGPGYASQLGVQMATVKAMLDSVMTGELF
mmetsp:Transcript_10392/g.19898  ORF Transcript_10392/g.19898 Transcript_10392/m.19898 type:complete len:90 (+) Transcript_10392:887-1156(+)